MFSGLMLYFVSKYIIQSHVFGYMLVFCPQLQFSQTYFRKRSTISFFTITFERQIPQIKKNTSGVCRLNKSTCFYTFEKSKLQTFIFYIFKCIESYYKSKMCMNFQMQIRTCFR
jgi:hypothetical protein